MMLGAEFGIKSIRKVRALMIDGVTSSEPETARAEAMATRAEIGNWRRY